MSGSTTLPQSYGVVLSLFFGSKRQSEQIVQSVDLKVESAYTLSFLLKNPWFTNHGGAPSEETLPNLSTTNSSVSFVLISRINYPLESPNLFH